MVILNRSGLALAADGKLFAFSKFIQATELGFRHIALLPLIILLLTSLGCVVNKPLKKGDVPESVTLAVDGIWESYPAKEKLQIEKGRIFFPEPLIINGVVQYEAEVLIAKNVKQTGPKSYVCEWLRPRGIRATNSVVTFDAASSTSLIFHFPAIPPVTTYDLQVPAEDLIYYRSQTGERPPQPEEAAQENAVKLQLDSEVKRVEASSELIEIPPGVTIEIKRSRTIEHNVNIETKGLGELKVDADLLDFLKGSVRVQIERLSGKSYKQSEVLEHKISLDGNKARQYKLVWYDKIRTGLAEFKVDNKSATVPFTFREWEDLDVIAIPNQK